MKGEIVVVAERIGDLYYVNELKEEHANTADTVTKSVLMKWHQKMGHLNEVSLKKMLEKEKNTSECKAGNMRSMYNG